MDIEFIFALAAQRCRNDEGLGQYGSEVKLDMRMRQEIPRVVIGWVNHAIYIQREIPINARVTRRCNHCRGQPEGREVNKHSLTRHPHTVVC